MVMGKTGHLAGKFLIAGLVLLVGAFGAGVEATGPRKEPVRICPRYSIPSEVLRRPFNFAGEVIPLRRPDVRHRVESQLNLLLLDARSVLATWLAEKSRHAWIFEEVFAKEGVPKDFMLLSPIIAGLAGGSSRKLLGAGWWAIDKPCSAPEGVEMVNDSWHDDRLDVELSTRCFIVRLKSIMKELGTKSWLLATAAYLTSTKQIEDIGKSWNTFEYWDLPLPENAEALIPRWIALSIIMSNRAAFGLNFSGPEPLTYDQVTGLLLAKDLSIADLAVMTGDPPRMVLELNPKIKPSQPRFPAMVDGKRVVHSLAVPKGKGRSVVEKLSKDGFLPEKNKP